MSAFALLLGMFWAGPALAADTGPSLTTLAAATNRPPECAALLSRAGARNTSRRPSVWRLARMPTLGAFCDDLARSDALMTSDPKTALKAAQDADVALPNRASASVAKGRALLATGDSGEALRAFQRALELDKRSLDEPKAMSDYARALVLSGKAAEAAPHYRALVPRAELLPDAARPLVYLRAAHALLVHAGAGGSAPASPSSSARADTVSTDLADAAAYLAEARTQQSSSLRGDLLFSSALIFDRAGDTEKANAALGEAARTGATLTNDGDGYTASTSDALALSALVAETKSASAGIDAWTKYLGAAPPDAWASAGKARLAALKRGGAKSAGDPRKEPLKPQPKKAKP